MMCPLSVNLISTCELHDQLLQLHGHVVSLTCLRAVRLSDVGQDVFVDEIFAS